MNRLLDFIHHLVVPNEKNDYRGKMLHIDFLSLYLLAAIILTFSFRTISMKLPNVLGIATDITTQKLYELTNEERAKVHVPPLRYNETLSKAAQKKAADMFMKNYWSHFGPNGETPWQFLLSSGYSYEYAGENLAKNFLFSKGVVDAWMQSPTHRDNLLKTEYQEVGFAVINGMLNGEETTLVVQMLGTAQNTPVQTTKIEKNEFIPVPKTVQAAENEALGKPVVNMKKTSYNIQFFFFGFLLIILGIDFYIAAKSNVIRFTGKSLAHIIFIGFILLGLVILTRGKII